ncbi:MAG: hypothetical protein U0X40_04830 [Ferruginibacter sp.]
MQQLKSTCLPVLAVCVCLFLVSCNNAEEKKDNTTPSADTSKNTTAAAAPSSAILIQHKVADFAKWRTAYFSHDSVRKAYGVTHFRICRGAEDSNRVIVMDFISDVARAKEFAASPSLKEAMQKAGVVGPPSVSFLNILRMDTSKIESMDRMMVTHKVKDYAAWLKVFDQEGKEARASFGMVDRVLARSAEDSNMVTLIFAVTDMAKAKARGNSPELKKLMTDAGVEGQPAITMMRLTQ